jgi:hypothetical protein
MKTRGLDFSFFEANGILFHRRARRLSPRCGGQPRALRSVLLLLAKSNCHPKFETHLSREGDGDYGLHGTNTWERWQLLNFYKYVFDRPGFNAQKMQEAKRDPDLDSLDK